MTAGQDEARAQDLVEGWCGKVLQPITKNDLAARIAAEFGKIRQEAYEAASEVAGEFDDCSYNGPGHVIPCEIAGAIRALIGEPNG